MTETFTDRTLKLLTVKSIHRYEGGRASIQGSDGWSALAPAEVAALLDVGDEYELEVQGFNAISGWKVGGKWIARKSDETFEAERTEWLAKYERDKRDRLDSNRADWTARESYLPDWLRDRITTFHEKGGEQFELEGWGYELIVCELAALYVASNLTDDDTINEFANVHGTSGNQHDVAKALARHHIANPDTSIAGTVSALSPLTGDAFYEGKKPDGAA